MTVIPIGENIRKLRVEQNVTQEKLADHLGVSGQAVSKWENQTTQPDIALLPDIAAYFGVAIDELFNSKMTVYGNAEGRLVSIYEIERTDEAYERAHEAYERLFSRGEGDASDRFSFALIHRMRAMDLEQRAEWEFRAIIEELEEARGVDYYQSHNQLIKMLVRTGRGAEAVEFNRVALEREPDEPQRYIMMSLAYDFTKDYEREREVIEEGLARFRDHAELTLCKAGVEHSVGNYEKSIALSDRAFELNPEMAPALHQKADSLMALKRYREGTDVWREVAKWLWARGYDLDARFAERQVREFEKTYGLV